MDCQNGQVHGYLQNGLDPDYIHHIPHAPASHTDPPPILSDEVSRVKGIITRQFNDEESNLTADIWESDARLCESRLLLDRLRAGMLIAFYDQKNKTKESQQDITKVNKSPGIHPAIKREIGKTIATPETAIKKSLLECIDESNRLEIASNITSRDAFREKNSSPRNPKKTLRVVVGNVSKYLSETCRDGRDQACFKWMVYVRGSRENPDISEYVDKVWFFLHPTYKPNDLVEVKSYPFHLTRRGWGEFPVRVQIHLRNSNRKRYDIIHHLRLDPSHSGVQQLGSETHVDILIEPPGLVLSTMLPSIKSEQYSDERAKLDVAPTSSDETIAHTPKHTTIKHSISPEKPKTVSILKRKLPLHVSIQSEGKPSIKLARSPTPALTQHVNIIKPLINGRTIQPGLTVQTVQIKDKACNVAHNGLSLAKSGPTMQSLIRPELLAKASSVGTGTSNPPKLVSILRPRGATPNDKRTILVSPSQPLNAKQLPGHFRCKLPNGKMFLVKRNTNPHITTQSRLASPILVSSMNNIKHSPQLIPKFRVHDLPKHRNHSTLVQPLWDKIYKAQKKELPSLSEIKNKTEYIEALLHCYPLTMDGELNFPEINPTLEKYRKLPMFKRRALEWQRGKYVERRMKMMYKTVSSTTSEMEESRQQIFVPWKSKAIVIYARRHLHTPFTPGCGFWPDVSLPTDGHCNQLSPYTSLLSQAKPSETLLTVDIISTGNSSPSVENSDRFALLASSPATNENLFISKLINPFVSRPLRSGPSLKTNDIQADDVLFFAYEVFMQDLIRGAVAKYASGKPEYLDVASEDVLAAIQSQERFTFLSDSFMSLPEERSSNND